MIPNINQFNTVLYTNEKSKEYTPHQCVDDFIKIVRQSMEKKIAINESVKSFFIDHEQEFKRVEFVKNVVDVALCYKRLESNLLLSVITLDEFKKGNKSPLFEIIQNSINEYSLYGKNISFEIFSLIVSKYNINDEKIKQFVLIEVVKILADQNSVEVCEHIQEYGIDSKTEEGQKGLIEIAKICAQNKGYELSKNFKNFEIDNSTNQGQKEIIEIAMLASECSMISEHIKNFGINPKTVEGQKALVAIAMAQAAVGEYTHAIYNFIENYEIDGSTEEGQKNLVQLAKLSITKSGKWTAKYIRNFGINENSNKGKLALIELAKMAISADGAAVEYIKNFGIDSDNEEGQKLLIEIAKNEASHNGSSLALNFEYYRINANSEEGKQAIFDIVEKAVSQDAGACEFIKNFGIDASTKEGQQFLIKLAKIAAAEDGVFTTKKIKNFGIDSNTEEGKQALIDIAKIAIAQNGIVIKGIENFGINRNAKESQPILIELALIGVENNGNTNRYIKEFRIDGSTAEGQEILIKIAKKAAAKDGYRLSEYIKDYGIDHSSTEGKQALIEIALIAVAQNGGASRYIEDFFIDHRCIEGQQALVRIALLAAAQDGDETSYWFNRYSIEGQINIIKIAMVAATQNGGKTSELIQNYAIDDTSKEGQNALKEIANKAILQNAKGSSQFIQNYKIEDYSSRLNLFITAFVTDRKSSEYIQNYKLDEFEKNWSSPLKIAEKLFGRDSDILKITNSLVEDIEKQSNEQIKKELNEWLKFTICCFYRDGKKTLSSRQTEILRETIKYRDPTMRYHLSSALIELNENQSKVFEILIKDKNYDYITLPSLLLPYLMKSEKKWSEIILKLQNKALFKDSSSHRPLINTLYQLKVSPVLTEDDILNLLNKAIIFDDKKQTVSNLKIIQGVISLKKTQELKKDSLNKYDDLSALYQTLFKQFIPIKEIENFGEKFVNTFFDPRVNSSLLVYAGKMNSHLENEKTMQAFVAFVESVLEGTFLKNRYDMNNIHLKTVFKGRERKLKIWMDGGNEELLEDIKSPEPLSRNYNKIFIDKIINDKHLDPNKYTHIKNYLEANENEKKKIEELLEADTIKLKVEKLNHIEEKEKVNQGKIELNALLLQIEMINLIKGLKEEDQLKTLHRINQLTPKGSEFLNDIKGLVNSFEKKEIKDVLTVFDTDNYKDLLLCGTEVDGSCQRVDGEPDTNCGLLAYLLDGKIRLLAIKDKDGKIIARKILRILWDSKNKTPVLVMERAYPSVIQPAHEKGLDSFAKKRAEQLGLALYDANKKDSVVCLESLDCPVSWEYVDSAGGMTNGKYKVTKAALVVDYTKL